MSRIVGLAIFVAAWFCCASANAARLHEITIERDGKTVLRGIASDSGREETADLWSCLHRVEFEREGDAKLEIGDDAKRAVIRGPVVIRISRAKRSPSDVRLTDLQLVRDHVNAKFWTLPPEEVMRALDAARVKYGPQDDAERTHRTIWIAVIIAAAIVVTIVGIWLWRKADAPSPTAG